jgi:hypothetical protein
MSRFHPWRYEGKTALISDAATPLGLAFAEEVAKRGTHLILVACASGSLPVLARRLSLWYAVQVDVLIADVSEVDAVQAVYQAVQQRGLRVDLLITTSGEIAPGQVKRQNPAHVAGQFLRQTLVVANLIHMALPPMLEREQGAIIVTAAATRYRLPEFMFRQTCWAACRASGVQVLMLLCPSALELIDAATPHQHLSLPRANFTPARMAEQALWALERGRHIVAPGWFDALMACHFQKHSPQRASNILAHGA